MVYLASDTSIRLMVPLVEYKALVVVVVAHMVSEFEAFVSSLLPEMELQVSDNCIHQVLVQVQVVYMVLVVEVEVHMVSELVVVVAA